MEENVDSSITLLRRIKRTLHFEGQWEIRHVLRECNLVADHLAKISLSWQTPLWIFEVPPDGIILMISTSLLGGFKELYSPTSKPMIYEAS
ncbi:hypothetical protein J1N35_008679 [Gossypium stocksii]|uniref:RNase H type-1 domain-containing protein n=1 Tax=Gossypium stocksii TaxID=47602 RepID=A0A9D3W9J6_9ROSI|nr:hypothetical protein J1N35_008679 [Gossypium stocksii]